MWRCKRYFRSQGLQHWIFSAAGRDEEGNTTFIDLFKASNTPIRRHVKIRAEATPYDPQFKEYFLKRKLLRVRKETKINQKGEPPNFNSSRGVKRAIGSVETGLRKA